MMKIAIDAFGGDNAPEEIVKGGCMAANELPEAEIIFVGDEAKLKPMLDGCSNVTVKHAPDVIEVCEDPLHALKTKKESSMVVGLNLVKTGEADAFISAGSTGALISGATLIVKRIKGIRRAALAPIIPTDKGCSMLIDAGSNLECQPEFLRDFALMGSIYMEHIMKVKNPSVGLVNVGTEENKGTETLRQTYQLLKEENLNFAGNIEAREIPYGPADVLVTDGMTGNVILKFMEGMGSYFNKTLKGLFKKNLITKCAALLVKGGLMEFKQKMNYEDYGGAPILGVNGLVMKAHGSSKYKEIYVSVKQAASFIESGAIEHIKECIGE